MKWSVLLGFLIIVLACNSYKELPPPAVNTGWRIKTIPPASQVPAGDPEKGLDYILNGDYIGSGIPYAVFKKKISKGAFTASPIDRAGINKGLPLVLTAFEAQNGVQVVNGNCFSCHAGQLNGKTIPGLGDSFSNFKSNMKLLGFAMNLGMKLKFGKKSDEWEAYENFGHYFRNAAPYIKTEFKGPNPAAMLAEACAMHRDPSDLSYLETPNFEMPHYAIATDVPPLWNLAKKNALYYTAVGRGDFTKLLFQASVLGIPDTAAARDAINHFKDVIAWIKTLEPPSYPNPIDYNLAQKGEILFDENCSNCHGTYGNEEFYPNKVVSLDVVKTDPLYASYAVQAPIVDWYNKSWFANSEPASFFQPEAGYIAPPLDGIWATAPYLHNASIPTLEDLLNSYQRPKYWTRSGNPADYDYEKVGWHYTTQKSGKKNWTFDTTLPGYSNTGHDFGDHLNSEDRKALIEYLKTL